MNIDQNWVTENIDLIMKEFLNQHPEFKKTDDNTMSFKSREKRKMLDNMDTMKYRPIYYIVKKFPDREKALRQKVKEKIEEKEDYKKSNKVFISQIDTLEKQIRELKDKNRRLELQLSQYSLK